MPCYYDLSEEDPGWLAGGMWDIVVMAAVRICMQYQDFLVVKSRDNHLAVVICIMIIVGANTGNQTTK